MYACGMHKNYSAPNSVSHGQKLSAGDDTKLTCWLSSSIATLCYKLYLLSNFQVPELAASQIKLQIQITDTPTSVWEQQLGIILTQKCDFQETPSEPLNDEVTEEIGKTSLMAEEETANEFLGGESKLQSESQGEEPLTLFVPLILESPAKPSEDTVSEVRELKQNLKLSFLQSVHTLLFFLLLSNRQKVAPTIV